MLNIEEITLVPKQKRELCLLPFTDFTIRKSPCGTLFHLWAWDESIFFRRKALVFLGDNSTINQNKTLKHSNTQLAVRYGHRIVAHEPIWSFIRVMSILHVCAEINVAFSSKNPTGVSQLAPLEVVMSILLYIIE